MLRAQVERMLNDPKAERFVADFLDQWLELRDIDATSPDRKLYPEFGPWLHDAMLGESRAYFRELLRNDLGVRHVVAADFAVLNQKMAQHYGIPGVSGAEFRKVPLPPNSHRGGFLTQASVLKVTANGTVTTPVKRGAWVMRQIVGEPPPPPPPDVPAVEPDISGTVTIREQLAKHRTNKTCAAAGWPWVVSHPGLPQIRTCPIKAYGSSVVDSLLTVHRMDDLHRRQRVTLEHTCEPRPRPDPAALAAGQPLPP
jgi:hypothetical protein